MWYNATLMVHPQAGGTNTINPAAKMGTKQQHKNV